MPWNWNSERLRTPISYGMVVASKRPKTAATSSASVGAIFAMIIVWCTGTPASLRSGKGRSDAGKARRKRPPRASATRRVRGRALGWAIGDPRIPRRERDGRSPWSGDTDRGGGSRDQRGTPTPSVRREPLLGYESSTNPGRRAGGGGGAPGGPIAFGPSDLRTPETRKPGGAGASATEPERS